MPWPLRPSALVQPALVPFMDCTGFTATLSDGYHRPCNAITTSDFIFTSKTTGAFVNRNWVIENKLALDEKWSELHCIPWTQRTRNFRFIVGYFDNRVSVCRTLEKVRSFVCMFVCLFVCKGKVKGRKKQWSIETSRLHLQAAGKQWRGRPVCVCQHSLLTSWFMRRSAEKKALMDENRQTFSPK
jgi:hypothetical protein